MELRTNPGSPGIGNDASACELRIRRASCSGGSFCSLPKHSWIKSKRYINVRSAGPLISKFLNRQLARKRVIASSIMSSPSCSDATGAGPRTFVLIGSSAILPMTP